jgi:hypothetical protein
VTGTSAEEEPTEHAGKDAEPSFWDSFNQADVKLFVVTFAGTLAANIVTVLVVAFAVIADRTSNRPVDTPITIALTAPVVFVGFLAMTAGDRLLRRQRKIARRRKVFLWILVLTWPIVLTAVLVLLGWAAGIK